ncbi:rhomboid-like protein [Streptomyces fuscichromogenes]|uniref:rhomboid-like protein n=1 Tax=Streptomyces fuscichromogenes TaxID=1324013 RepID=UPI0038014662
MERTVRAASTPTPQPLPAGDVAALLDGVPRQRGVLAVPVPGAAGAALLPSPWRLPAGRPHRLRLRPWRLLPTPTGTPVIFAYTTILALTSLFASYTGPGLVHALYQDSSTDVAHLLRTPVFVLLASALWVAGGLLSPFALAFVLVLTALERRIGGARAILVFLTGHVLATLATEVPVGLAVLVGHLPDTSLHRLDYGISFGTAASIGALCGLLTPWLRWPLLALVGYSLVADLLAFQDPMTNWGHLIALAIGTALWPAVRRWRRERAQDPAVAVAA